VQEHLTGGLRPDAKGSGVEWRATHHQPGRDFRKAHKTATVCLGFDVHPENIGSTISTGSGATNQLQPNLFRNTTAIYPHADFVR
jgi:hypothetical protein